MLAPTVRSYGERLRRLSANVHSGQSASRLRRRRLPSLDRLPLNELAMTRELIADMLGMRCE